MDESNKSWTERVREEVARRWHNWRQARSNIAALEQCGAAELERMAHDTA